MVVVAQVSFWSKHDGPPGSLLSWARRGILKTASESLGRSTERRVARQAEDESRSFCVPAFSGTCQIDGRGASREQWFCELRMGELAVHGLNLKRNADGSSTVEPRIGSRSDGPRSVGEGSCLYQELAVCGVWWFPLLVCPGQAGLVLAAGPEVSITWPGGKQTGCPSAHGASHTRRRKRKSACEDARSRHASRRLVHGINNSPRRGVSCMASVTPARRGEALGTLAEEQATGLGLPGAAEREQAAVPWEGCPASSGRVEAGERVFVLRDPSLLWRSLMGGMMGANVPC